MAAASTTNLASILKTIWPQSDITDLFYDDSPLFAMLPKDTTWAGQNRVVAVQYGQVNGRSASYDKARTNADRSKVASMTISTSDNYAVWQVEHKLMILSRNDKGAIVRAVERETKSAMKKFKRSLAFMVYGNGGGALGQIASIATSGSNTIYTVKDPRTLRYIEEGDVLALSTADGTSGSLRSGTMTVTGVDVDAGTFTILTAGAISGAAANDYIFVDGDFGKVMYGLNAYLPTSTPTTTIWGMTRTANPQRLGGIRVGGKGLLIQEAVKKALVKAKDAGASVSHIFMSSNDFLNLELALGTTVRRTDEKVSANVGFTGIEFSYGSSKPVKVFLDPDCPSGLVYGLQMDTWTLASAGEYPDFLTMDGNKFDLLQSSSLTSPTFEGRIGGYAQLYTDAPGFNFVLNLNA